MDTTAGSVAPVAEDFEPYRQELTGYCYRMLGAGTEAEDAVQETLLRAWRNSSSFEGRSSVRTWLYRIAANVCIDMGREVQRRVRPVDLGPASAPRESLLGPPRPELPWVMPIADGAVIGGGDDPAVVAETRDSIRLAFVTALQHLPERQRAVLILRDVLHFHAGEVAEILGTTTASVNSLLQRARTGLDDLPDGFTPRPLDADSHELLERYLDAFERYDVDELVTLLHEDATQSMPPFELWIQGADAIGAWMVEPGPSGCRGSKLVAVSANGCPAFGQYRRDPKGGYLPWAVQVLEVAGGRIADMSFFLALADPERLFASFGLPPRLDT